MVKKIMAFPLAFVKALGIVVFGFLTIALVFYASYLMSVGVGWVIGGNDKVIRTVVQFPVFILAFATFAAMAAMPKRIVEGIRGKAFSDKVKE